MSTIDADNCRQQPSAAKQQIGDERDDDVLRQLFHHLDDVMMM